MWVRVPGIVQIEMKKLRFHTPGADGKSKCHQIHVGRPNEFCPTLHVHGTKMLSVTSDTYLGDVVSGDGSNKINIETRVSKGLGKIAQIMSMVGKISLGKHYFKIALLLRESLFLSSILTNSEVWYRVTKAEIEELELLDRSLIKRIFSVPDSTPSSALFLETGCIRVGTTIKARRVNFLYYLIKLPKDEMLSRFFYCQWYDSNQYDWTRQVRQDLEDLNLPTELEIIEKRSAFSWKNLVKRKVKEYEFRNLLKIKEEKNSSKMENLKYEKLEKQGYLTKLDVWQAKEVFRFRTRMSDFSGNYRGQGPVELCPLCGQHEDLQNLCFQCPVVLENVRIKGKYEEIFEPNITLTLAKTLSEIAKMRKKEE